MGNKRKYRKPTEIIQDRATIASLFKQGVPQYKIAQELALSESSISLELKKLRDIWRKEFIDDINEILRQQLATIDALEYEAWQAWFESKEDAEKIVEKTGDKDNSTTETREGQSGDASYFKTIQWCVEQRLKIFGLYKQPNANEAPLTVNMTFLTQINEQLKTIEQETQAQIIEQYPFVIDYLQAGNNE